MPYMATRSTSEPQYWQPSLFDMTFPTPGQCRYERRWITFGSKPKSECEYRDGIVWTNCREINRCIWND